MNSPAIFKSRLTCAITPATKEFVAQKLGPRFETIGASELIPAQRSPDDDRASRYFRCRFTLGAATGHPLEHKQWEKAVSDEFTAEILGRVDAILQSDPPITSPNGLPLSPARRSSG